MPEKGHAATDLDARLAEIDSRLRSIQAELAPENAADANPAAQPRLEQAPPVEHEEALPDEPPTAPERAEPSLPHGRAEPSAPGAPPVPHARGRSGPLETLLQRAAQQARDASRVAEDALRAVHELRVVPEPPATHEPPRPQEPPHVDAPPAEPGRDPLGQVQALTDIHMQLLASSHELLEAYQELVEQLQAASQSDPIEVTVDAGPFMSLDAVRDFEHALRRLAGVLDVAVRGYERGNRAIVDVQLRPPGK